MQSYQYMAKFESIHVSVYANVRIQSMSSHVMSLLYPESKNVKNLEYKIQM